MNPKSNPFRSDDSRRQRILTIAEALGTSTQRSFDLHWPDETAEQRAMAATLDPGPGTILSLADQLRPHSPLVASGVVEIMRRDQFQSEVLPILDRSLLAAWGDATSTDLFDGHSQTVADVEPRRVSAYVKISDQIATQNPTYAGIFAEAQILAAIAGAIDRAVIQGSGADGEPLGISNDSDLPEVEVAGTLPAVAFADLTGMEKLLCDGHEELSGASWIASSTTRQALRSTAAPADAAWAPSPQGPLGRPVVASAHAPANFLALVERGSIAVPVWSMKIESVISREERLAGWKTIFVSAFCDVAIARPNAVVKLVPAA